MTHTEMKKTSSGTDVSQKESVVEKELTLGVVLPSGTEKTMTIHGSKPVLDLLVILCAKYHLNPSNHNIELISDNGHCIKSKPNALIETLEVKKILIKPKGTVDKNKKQSPRMPEATVRLVINYKTTHKAVLRVSPQVPAEELMPAICAKCELDQSTTVLLRSPSSGEPLDLTQSLNDLGLREVYAVDSKGVSPEKVSVSPRHEGDKSPLSEDKVLKEKENKGLFSIFRKSKKKPDQVVSVSDLASPAVARDGGQASTGSSEARLPVTQKKRRAPPPPIMASQSFHSNLGDQQADSLSHAKPHNGQGEYKLSHGPMKGLKRKAPPPPTPPCTSAPEEPAEDKSIKAVTPSDQEEISEPQAGATAADLDSSTAHIAQENAGSLDLSTEASMDSGKPEPTCPPVDTETQETSPILDMGPELEQESKQSTEEMLEVEVTHTLELENRVSADCGSSLEETKETHGNSGGNSVTTDCRNEMVMSEEDHKEEPPPTLMEESPAQQCQNGAGSSSSLNKEAVLKTKPSIELARQCIPRDRLTTYTIVPSKTVDKVKYFEVALTLEDPAVALKENEAPSSPEPATYNPKSSEPHDSVVESCITMELSDGAATVENADSGPMAPTPPAPAEVPEADEDSGQPPTSCDGASEVGPVQEIKERKTPPAVKPKPDAFILPQQTRICADDRTDAAMKANACAVSPCAQENAGRAGKEEPMGDKEEGSIPPHPPYPPPHPPMASNKRQKDTERQQEGDAQSKGMSGRGGGNLRNTTNELEQPAELDLKKLTSLATPKPYKATEPSSFSKAVFAASKRSQIASPPAQPLASKVQMEKNKSQ